MSQPGEWGRTHGHVPGSSRVDSVCDEFERHWNSGDRPRIEAYLGGSHGAERGRLLKELLEIEVVARQRAEEPVTAEEYVSRFPEDAALVQLVFDRVSKPSGHPLESLQTGEYGSASTAKCRRLGDYELLEELGRGGMGVVYRARQVYLDQTVAIKVLPSHYLREPQAVARFHREMQSIGRLDHPNIVRALNAGETEGTQFLVMEYVAGLNLQRLLSGRMARGQGPLSAGAACEIIRQAALGLQHAHENGLVHRDVKPANLIVDRGGEVKILDLGLAKFQAERRGGDQLTQEGMIVGTLDYMAPEQWGSSVAVDIRADIYSLGCTFFFLLTGRPPYGGPAYDTSRSKAMAHMVAPLPSLADYYPVVTEDHERILAHMMAKEPDERFDTPGEVAEAIGLLAEREELVATLAQVGDRKEPPSLSGARSGEGTVRKSGRPSGGSRSGTKSLRARSHSYRRQILIGAVALGLMAVAGLAMWLASRADPNALSVAERRQLCDGLGTFPGVNGNWWFDETPWLVPGVRAQLLQAIDGKETAIGGLLLRPLLAKMCDADVSAFHRDLRAMTEVVVDRLPSSHRGVAEQLLVADPELRTVPDFEKDLQAILDQFPDTDEPACLHLRAVLLHKLMLWKDAAAAYEKAVDRYEQQDRVPAELYALCLADYGRLLADIRNYKKAVPRFQDARGLSGAPAFTVYCLCQEADSQRRLANLTAAQQDLDKAREILDAESDQRLDADHPMRAVILERAAWIALDQWQMKKASLVLEQASQIRRKNRDLGNPRSWRWIASNELLSAMAEHYLGHTSEAEKRCRHLLEALNSVVVGNDFQQAATKKQRTELRERRSMVHERLADCYLFGESLRPLEAAGVLREAIKASDDENFDETSRWPTIANLRYKLAITLFLTKQPQEAEEVMRRADEVIAEKKKEPKYRPEQGKTFGSVQRLALAVKWLRAGGDESRRGQAELESLVLETPPTRLERRDLEPKLMAAELLFDSPGVSPGLQSRVARRLVILTEEPRRSPDREITQKYLRRYFLAAAKALEKSAAAGANSDLQTELKQVRDVLNQ